jgi:polyhydroxybutyrate depolymerase
MASLNALHGPKQTLRGATSLAWQLATLAVLPLALACSSSEDEPGSLSNSGGASSVGGNSSAAGQSPSGGMVSSGGGMTGASGSGGAATGGATTGGATTGGAATGGSGAGGGTAAGAGGAAAGASPGGASTGGAAGASMGGAGGGSQGMGSPGCGSASPLKSGNFTETIDGAMRKYVLDVPANYDANKKHRLIFVWHPLGGSASQVVNGGYNGLKSLSEGSAIFVAADGLNGSNGEASGPGWWNANGVDMKLLTAILSKVNANLCIDSQRIFSTGFSFGGMMSYSVGYEFDVFRAIAPCSGDLQVIPHKETYTAPLPIMAFHGDKDDFVTTARGRAARDKYLARNKCGSTTTPASPSPCVEYQGCSAPTFWCEFPGAHNTWSEQPKAIWKFFSQF